MPLLPVEAPDRVPRGRVVFYHAPSRAPLSARDIHGGSIPLRPLAGLLLGRPCRRRGVERDPPWADGVGPVWGGGRGPPDSGCRVRYPNMALFWSQADTARAVAEWEAALRENPAHAQAREWLAVARRPAR